MTATTYGVGQLVAAIGNIVFVGSAVFTLVVAFLAWRRGNRAAGWFLIAWGMLETVAIFTAVRLLLDRAENAEGLLYYGLPLSMVAAAILVALGVADRLREQRAAAVVPPIGEALPNTEIFRLLAERMGLREPCFRESDEQMLAGLFADAPAGVTLATANPVGLGDA